MFPSVLAGGCRSHVGLAPSSYLNLKRKPYTSTSESTNRGTRRGVPVFQAHADVRRPGRPAERRPDGGSARQLGRVGCHAAALHGAAKVDGPCGRIFPGSPLCGVPKASHRRPGGGLLGQARRPDKVAAHEGAALMNRSNAPRGPRWAVGSRTSRLQCLCAADVARAARGHASGRAALRGGLTSRA